MVQGRKITLTKDEILDEIVRISNLDTVPNDPRVCDMNEYGEVSAATVVDRFNSWTKAKELAGIDNIRQHSSSRQILTCAICGNTDSRPKSEYINNNGDWLCSSECSKSYYRKTKPCANCGEIVERPNSQIDKSDTIYCSMSCKREDERTSSKHRARLGKWANMVKQSSNYICEDCGESYDVMCAHHNPPRSELSSKSEELNLDNGVCLCYPCHENRHKGTHKERIILSWWEWYNSKNNI